MSEEVVHKHELRGELVDLELIFGAEVLHVAHQMGRMQLWERHRADELRTSVRRFRIAGTGHPFPGGSRHVGSLLVHGGTYVFHVFEEPR